MRRLNRRLQRWQRYAARYGYPSPALMELSWDPPLSGHKRAYRAVQAEEERRFELPSTDRITMDPHGATCRGPS